MFQIDNSTAVAAIPAPTPDGSAGYFTDGNPATGVSATILPAEFMNMLMMENMNVLAAAGIAPAKGQYNQLALAIAKIVQGGAAGQASEATAGILKLSTNPQALAGTDDSTAITPLKLAQKLANFLGQATEVAFGWLKIATQALVNAGADDATAVTPKKLAAAIQSQALTAFTTAGSAGALTLTPVPAIQAYATPLRFRVKFSQNSTGTDTLNISGIGAKSIKQYDSSGAKVTAVFAANQLADVEYDGTDFVLLDQLPAGGANLIGIQGLFKNLAVSSTGLSALVTCTVDEIMVENASNQYQVLRSVSVAPSLAAAGANGLDTGTSAASTWYSVWVIWNGTTTAGLLSLSATAPTMPSGYTHKARVGWVRTDGTANKYPLNFMQFGRRAQYRLGAGTNLTATPVLSSGIIGSPSAGTYIAVSLANFVPPTTARVFFTSLSASASQAVAPSANYGPSNGATNAPPFCTSAGSTNNNIAQGELAIEVMSLYIAADGASCRVYVTGWEDNL